MYWGDGFKAGIFPDIEIARRGICLLLDPGEKILADKGYQDPFYFVYPATERDDNVLLKKFQLEMKT